MGGGEVVIVDDVLKTGGTLKETNELRKKKDIVVGNLVLIDLKYVPRVDNFDLDVRSVVSYV